MFKKKLVFIFIFSLIVFSCAEFQNIENFLNIGKNTVGNYRNSLFNSVVGRLEDSGKKIQNGFSKIYKETSKKVLKNLGTKKILNQDRIDVKVDKSRFLVSPTKPASPTSNALGTSVHSLGNSVLSGFKLVASSLIRLKQVTEVISHVKYVKDQSQLFSSQKLKRSQFLNIVSKIEQEQKELLSIVGNINPYMQDTEFLNITNYYMQKKEELETTISSTTLFIDKEMEVSQSIQLGASSSFGENLITNAVDFALTKNPLPVVLGIADVVAQCVSQKNHEKLQYTQIQLNKIKELLKSQNDNLQKIHRTVMDIRSEREVEKRRRMEIMSAITFDTKIFAWVSLGIGLTWMAGMIYMFVGGIHRARQQHSPLAYVSWTIALCVVFFILLFSFDTVAVLQRQKAIEKSFSIKKAQVQLQEVKKRYQAECVWYEIPLSRQLSLELRGLFWTMLLQDGFKSLSTDMNGNMISDSTCQSYLEMMALSPEEMSSTIESVSRAYGSIFTSIAKRLAEIVVVFAQELLRLPFRVQMLLYALILISVLVKGTFLLSPLHWISNIFSFLTSPFAHQSKEPVIHDHVLPKRKHRKKDAIYIPNPNPKPSLIPIGEVNHNLLHHVHLENRSNAEGNGHAIPLGLGTLEIALLR